MKKQITLLNFHGLDNHQEWLLETIPSKGDLINFMGKRKIVIYIEYIFSNENNCEILIRTETILT